MTIKLAKSLSLPVELAGRRTAVFGISGSGKSNTATVLMEQLLRAGEQTVLIDPKGEGWGLLSLASGKPSNLPIIVFGEPNGHIETLSESHGQRLADFVVETGQSVVLSMLGFESDQSERRFVSTFLRQLYRRKSRQPQPTRTLVVIDEAHLFVPENVRGDAAELAGAVQRIVRQGRSFGLGTLLIDQRPQDVSKRCISQVDTLVCHQLVHKTDRDALRDWVRGYDVDGRGERIHVRFRLLQQRARSSAVDRSRTGLCARRGREGGGCVFRVRPGVLSIRMRLDKPFAAPNISASIPHYFVARIRARMQQAPLPQADELPEEWRAAYMKACTLLWTACQRAVQSKGYGEVVARIPANGPKGPGRENSEFKETFV